MPSSEKKNKENPSLALSKKSNKPFYPSSLKSGLYSIFCVPKQKQYIGYSTYVTRRLNAHKNKLRRGIHECKALQEDFSHYGEQNFVFQKLYLGAGLPVQDLQQLETTVLLTLPPASRYNLYTNWRKRQGTLNPFSGKKHTSQARKAQSDANLEKSGFAGHHQSTRVKQIVSQHNSGKKDRRKPLYIENVYYESISEAHEKTGLARRLIRERCHSQKPEFADYRFLTPDEMEQGHEIS